MAVDMVIKGGLIVDGSGGKPYRGDVAIRDGRIVTVGSSSESAQRVLDADGLVVAPGFWDLHTHYDAQFLFEPTATSSIWHGVTTVIQGNCGFSIAPCRPQDYDWMVRTMGRVEGMNVDVLRPTLPWPWGDFGAYLDRLDQALGVNVLPQVGHTAIRRYVMGADASARPCTDDELQQMKQVLADSLSAGAIGFTTSRSINHFEGDGLPIPSRFATSEEYLELVKEVQALNVGFIQHHPTDFSLNTKEGAERLVEVARLSGRPVCLNMVNSQDQLEAMLRLRDEGVPCFGMGRLWNNQFEMTFKDTNMFDHIPPMQQLIMQPKDKKMGMMRDPAFRRQAKEEFLVDRMLGRGGPYPWDRFSLVRSATGKYRGLEGLGILEIGERLGKDPVDAAFDIALDEDLETHFRLLGGGGSLDDLVDIFKAPHVVPGMSDAGAHLMSAVNAGFPTRLLGYWVREREAMTVEEAVRKLSGAVADELGIPDRGYIREGMPGDISIFDPATVADSDRTFANDLPGGASRLVQHAVGVEYVIVNGQITLEHGKHTGALGGKTVRSSHYKK